MFLQHIAPQHRLYTRQMVVVVEAGRTHAADSATEGFIAVQ